MLEHLMCTPAEPNSDGWTSFELTPERLYDLVPSDCFLLPEDAQGDHRALHPAAISYFPSQIKGKRDSGDAGLIDAIMISRKWAVEDFLAGRTKDFNVSWSAWCALVEEIQLSVKATRGHFDHELRQISQKHCEFANILAPIQDRGRNLMRENPEYAIAIYAQRLWDEIGRGSVHAARRYLEVLTVMVERLHQMATTSPKVFHELQRWHLRWPGLLSNHPYYARYSVPPKNLGHRYPFPIDQSCRWDPSSDISQVAIHLILYLHRLREALIKFCKANAVPPIQLGPNLRIILSLKDIQDEAPAWWEHAVAAFHATYPDPENQERFEAWVKASSHRKSPGRIRERIREKLRDAGSSLFSVEWIGSLEA